MFQLPPGEPLPSPDELLAKHANWIAALTRLECEPLSDEEMAQALAAHLSYSPNDLFLPDWSAALLIDRDCDETLQVIEFANLQLLEYRFLDDLLDDRLAEAHRFIRPLARSLVAVLASSRSLAAVARRIEDRRQQCVRTHGQFVETGRRSVPGARLSGFAEPFSPEGLGAKHRAIAEQSCRMCIAWYPIRPRTIGPSSLELIIILLILFEIVMAFVRRG